jgi:hypothetical protein
MGFGEAHVLDKLGNGIENLDSTHGTTDPFAIKDAELPHLRSY